MAIEGQAFEQGALAQLFGGIFSLAGRQIEPTVAGIRSAGQIGAAQASALGQQLSAQTSASAQAYTAQQRLEGTLQQIAGQMDVTTQKGQQELAQLLKKLESQETIADVQAAASKYSAEQQKAGQTEAATTRAGATTEAATTQAGASKYGAEQSRLGQEAAASTSAAAQKFGATTSAEAQKAVAALNIAGQLGVEGSQGIIGATSEAKQAEALQQLQAQMGLGGDEDTPGPYGEGIIRKQQQEQLGRELALSQEQASQQLGTGDYSTGGLIGAQSAAKIAEMQEAGKQKLGTPYSTLGEIAGSGIEQRMTQEQRAALARENMQAHADVLDTQQGKIAGRLGDVSTPFANLFGLGQVGPGPPGPGPTGQAATGINALQNIEGAGQIFPQTAAMDLVSGASGNPFMQPLTGLAGMTGAQNAGPNQLLAMQGAMNAQNQLGLSANQNLAQMGLGAAQNLSGAYNQGLATQTAALQPVSTAFGQGLAAIPQAQGQALAAMGGVGAGSV